MRGEKYIKFYDGGGILVLLLLIALAISLSKVPPAPKEIVQGEVFNKSFEGVWKATVNVLSEEEYPIGVIEKESGLITTDFVIFTKGLGVEREIDIVAVRPSIIFGTWSQGRYSLSIFVTEKNNGTLVRVKPHIEAYENNVTNSWHVCDSRGVIEEKLLGKIEQLLAQE
jgi:hypothetical protein